MNFQEKLEELADEALENAGKDGFYTEMDMFNATLVFIEVFSSRFYNNHKGKLNLEQLCNLFEEAGKSLHQSILLFTGDDMHLALKHEEIPDGFVSFKGTNLPYKDNFPLKGE